MFVVRAAQLPHISVDNTRLITCVMQVQGSVHLAGSGTCVCQVQMDGESVQRLLIGQPIAATHNRRLRSVCFQNT